MSIYAQQLREKAAALLLEAQRLYENDQDLEAIERTNAIIQMNFNHRFDELEIQAHMVAIPSYQASGDMLAAANHLNSAHQLCLFHGDPFLTACVRLLSGNLLLHIGCFREALTELQLAWDVIKDTTDLRQRYRNELLLGQTFCDLDQIQDSLAWFDKADKTAAQAGFQHLQLRAQTEAATTWMEEGIRESSRGHKEQAISAWNQSLKIALEHAPRSGQIATKSDRALYYVNISAVYFYLNRVFESEDALKKAESIVSSDFEYPPALISYHCQRARLLASHQKYSEASEAARVAIRIAQDSRYGNNLREAYLVLIYLDEQTGDLTAAREHRRMYQAELDAQQLDFSKRRSMVLSVWNSPPSS